MRRIAKLNIENSLRHQKLEFEENWLDKLDRFVIYLLFGGCIIYPLLLILGTDFRNNNEKFIALAILPLLILFGSYVIYRKATEKHLIRLNTPHNRQMTRQLLLEYAEKQQFEIYRKSSNCLILNASIGNFNPRYKKSMVFIIQDNMVYFTILKEHYKLNLPTLTSHLFLKSELNKILNQTQT